MSFPLIQYPAPLQQLADTVNRIREDRMARARDRRAEDYLHLQQAAEANNQQYRTAQLELARTRLQAEMTNSAADNARADAAQAFAQSLARRNQYISERIAAVDLPRVGNIGPVVDRAFAATGQNAAAVGQQALGLPGAAPVAVPDLAAQVTQARERSRPGLQGSAVRAPTIGTSDLGLTYTPGTESYNAPSVSGGGGQAQATQFLRDANLSALIDATTYLDRAERTNPEAAQRPMGATLLRGAAQRIAGAVAGDEVGDAAANIGRTDAQRQYWGAAEQWVHNYIPNLPGFRMSVPMFHSVQRAFFPPPGESNPATVRSFTNRRNAVTRELVNARRAGMGDQEAAALVAARLRQFGEGAAADELTRASRGAGATPPDVSTPDTRDGQPYVDPRFQ